MSLEKTDKVLIVDDFHPLLLKGLSELNIKFDYKPEIQREETLKIIENYQGFIVRSKIDCDKEFFEKAIHLKWIAKGGSGIDSIDENEANTRNIKLINAPKGNRNAVAEHTVGLILNLANNICSSYSDIKKLKWDREISRGVEIIEKTIGIIGFGNVGSTLAKRLSGFDMKVLAYDKYKKVESNYAQESTLEQIFQESDILTLHTPLTEETYGMVNTEFIDKFNKPIYLINASRGKVVKSADVLQALKLGKISGFAADVLENEKPQKWNESERKNYAELMKMRNVIFTPHVAGWTVESYEKLSIVIIDSLRQMYN